MNHTKWQTRRETGAQSQGSHGDSPAAEAFERKLTGFGNWVFFCHDQRVQAQLLWNFSR